MNKIQQYSEDCSDYKIISILSQCFDGQAVVNLARYELTGEMLAVKRFQMDKIKEDVYLVEREIILTRQLQHANILPYLTAFVNQSEVFVVSPLMAFGSCRSLLSTHFNEGLPELAIVIILRDVLDALDYVHKKGYIHRAVRASHVLVSDKGKACLTGLRYACPIVNNGRWQRNIHSFPPTTERNLNWLSPELLEQNMQGYNEKSDIYSIGMLTCELANGTEPFAGVATTLMLIEKVRGCVPQLLDCTTVPTNTDENDCQGDCNVSTTIANRKFSDDLHELAALCLQREAQDRPAAGHLLNHPVFKISKRGVVLSEVLRPAIPLSDRVAENTDELAQFENMKYLSDLDIPSYEWDFPG